MPTFPPIPPQVKHIAHFMKVADEHDERNIVISYWSRMYACESAMKSISGAKPPEVTQFLVSVMEWLEGVKKMYPDLEGVMNPTVGHALVEEYTLQLFNYADSQDKAEKFGKNMVKAFYTAGILMDTLQQFAPLTDDMFNKRKYAKWKAAYIHNCLKLGEEPFSGPPVARNLLKFSDEESEGEEEEDDEEESNSPARPEDEQPVNPGYAHPNEPTNPASLYPQPVNPQVMNFSDHPTIPLSPDPALVNMNEVPVPAPRSNSGAAVNLNAEQIEKAQKYCKWAGSALTYDDINNAIDNLQKALSLLQTGKEN